jgi:para-aminobenzoate synthetase component 2
LILMLDNYDSFTYNLVQYLQCLGEEVLVCRNDALGIGTIRAMSPAMIVLSPGPGTPGDAGICRNVVKTFHGVIPILGICLGHQTIGDALGGHVVRALRPVHGKVHPVVHDGKGLFCGLPSPLEVTRYHSLVLERETLPDCLEITAETSDGEIMGIRHKQSLLEGVQFHPEALMTQGGMRMLQNFLVMAKSQAERRTNADRRN